MLRRVVRVIVVAVVVLAVLTLVLRLALPRLHYYEGEIVARLSEIVGAEVRIGAMRAVLSGVEPIVELSQIHVAVPSGEALRAERMRVGFDLWTSLLEGQPVISDLHVADVDFLVVTDAAGSSHVSGVPLPLLGTGVLAQGDPVSALPDLNFRFERASVRWRNEQTGFNYAFENVSAVLESADGHLKFAIKGSPPPVFGRLLHIAADFRDVGDVDRQWDGRVYLRADEADLAEWARLVGGPDVVAGVLTAELWSDWRGGDLQRLDGAVNCVACVADNTADDVGPMSGQARLSWEAQEAGWRLALLDAALTGAGQGSSQGSGQGSGQSSSQGSASAPGLIVEHGDAAFVYREGGSRLVLRVPVLNKGLLRAASAVTEGIEISAAQGSAALSAVAVHPDFKPPRPSLAPAQTVSQWRDWLGRRLSFTGDYASGYVNHLLKHTAVETAQLDLKLQDSAVLFSDYSQGALAFDEVVASLRYLKQGSGYRVHADELSLLVGDGRVKGQLAWLDGETPQGEASLEIEALPLALIKQWLPDEKMNPRLKAWLDQAFVAGTLKSGRVEFSGAPALFPFKNGGGRFHVEGEVADVELNYRAKRKPLRKVDAHIVFDNQGLAVEASRLHYYDFQSQAVQVVVRDITAPFIEVEASGAGPFASVFEYLKDAQLINADSVVMDRLEPGGDSRLVLSVKAPLGRKLAKPVTVEGALSFDNASLRVTDPDFEFSDIAGVLHFDRDGGRAESLTARLNGIEVKGSAAPAAAPAVGRASGATALTLGAELGLSQLFDLSKTPLRNTIEGIAPWQADLLIPGPGADADYELEIRLASSLEGTAVTLPAPFDKRAAQKRDFSARVVLGGRNEYAFSYGETIEARLIKDARTDTSAPWGYLYFGDAAPPPIKRGVFNISGEIREAVEVDDWLGMVGGDSDFDAYLKRADLSFAELRKGGEVLGEASFVMEPHVGGRKLQLDAPWAHGWVFLPDADDREMFIKMEKLFLPESLSTATSNLKPAAVPALEMEVADFKRGDMHVSNLQLITEPTDDGMRIGTLMFEVGEVLVGMSGRWLFDGQQHHSSIDLEVNGRNYGKMLKLLDFSSGLKGGDGTLVGRVSWPGSPAEFAFENLEGDIRLNLKDGVIEKADPNISRLLGLFSVNHVVRRLSLDFRDVVEKGLAFDALEGNFNFHDSIMNTENFVIVGPALAMTVSGDNLIAERRYEQQIDVVPNLSSGLPVAGALLGGPIAAAGVLLIDKLTRLGDKMDKIVTLRYRLHGSWDDPQVDFEGTPEARLKDLGGIRKWFEKILP